MPFRFTRGRVVRATALLAVVALAVGVGIDTGRVELTRHVLGQPRAGRTPLRVVQLSDLHLHALGARERRAAALVRAERPDLVVLTGDLVGSVEELPLLDQLLSDMGDPPAVAAVIGNWETWGNVPDGSLRQVLARHHGVLLVNELLAGEREGRRWAVAGLEYPAGRLPRHERAALAAVPNRLLLAHSPEARDPWPGPPAAAMLSGHSHGGQIAPFGLALWVPHGCGRYVAGWYRGAPVDLYVSRGIGTSVVPLRLGARPEVAVFEWWLE